MRILLFNCSIHFKNLHGFKLMCESINAELVISDNINNITDYWDIVFIPSLFINPEYFKNTKHILYGPHAFLFPHGNWKNYNFDNRSKYIQPSEWAKNFVNELGGINLPIIISPFAVDTEKFKPQNNIKDLDCIFYSKNRSKEDEDYIESILISKNLSYEKFSYKTKYEEEDYIKGIDRCKFAIFLDSTESQGFAIEECLSKNVPVLVFGATSMFDEIDSFGKQVYQEYLGRYKLEGTTVPYWDERCGIVFTKKEEYVENLEKIMATYESFSPREYILENLSPKVCMERLLNNLKA